MKWLARIIGGLLFVVVFTFGVLFCVRNSQPISLDLIFFKTPDLSLGVLLILTFLSGGLLGGLLSGAAAIKVSLKKASYGRQLHKQEQELSRLKNDVRSNV